MLFGMRKKLAAIIISALLAALAAFGVFYSTRPVVAFVFPDVGKQYFKRLDKPGALTAGYRTVFPKPDELEKYDDIKLIINHTGVGIEYPADIFDVPYDPSTLFHDVMSSIPPGDMVVLYDRQDEYEMEFVRKAGQDFLGIRAIGYDGVMQRVDYPVNSSEIGEGDVLVVLDAGAVSGFLEYLGNPRFIVDYLDAAALGELEPEAVATWDWDKIILSFLKKGTAGG